MAAPLRPIAALTLVLLLAGCSGGGGAPPPVPLDAVTTAGASFADGTAAATCPAGSAACGASGFCCPTGSACLANPTGTLCDADFCCLSCSAGSTCGAGCCAAGTSCVGNPGGVTGCSTGLCCSPTPDPSACPVDVAAQCPGGTRCLANRSARYCEGGYACYLPSGGVGCPGEVLCGNGVDFCPEDTYCAPVDGVCATGSTSGNYCCKAYAQPGDSCDTTLCAPGLSCVDNPHCANSDPYAAKTCKGPCTGTWAMDCGTFCCNPTTTDFCGAPNSCECMYWY